MKELLLKIISKTDQVITYDIREYFGSKVIAFTTENSQKHYSSCPWCFAIGCVNYLTL